MKNPIALARIKTKSGGYICCINLGYSKFQCFFADKDMKVSRPANLSEWVWATTHWEKPIEHIIVEGTGYLELPLSEFGDRVNYPNHDAMMDTQPRTF